VANNALRFRIAKVPIEIPFSGLLGVVIIAILWAPSFPGTNGSSSYPLALAFAVLLYAVILVHELAHAAVAHLLGFPVRGITLWILGGYTVFEHPRRSAWREGLIAVAGPLSTLLVSAICFGVRDSLGSGRVLIATLGWAALLLGVFNLLPGLPLDGGVVLSNVVWALGRSEHSGVVVGAWAGRVLALIVGLGPIIAQRGNSSFDPSLLTGLLLGFFLWSGASRALVTARVERQLPELSILPLTRRAIGVQRDVPLAEALRQLGIAEAGGIVVLDRGDQPVGIVNESAVAAVPAARRPWVPVSTVSRTLEPEGTISLDLTGPALIEALRAVDAPELLVTTPTGAVFGILARADVERLLSGIARGRGPRPATGKS
jgi:Zn-dependent protease